jgi:hypothetical protein
MGLFLNAAQSPHRGSGQSGPGAGRCCLCHALLEIGVEQLVRVQFRRVTGQIEDLDLAGVRRELLPYRLGVMHPQVIEDQEDLLLLSARQPIEKANQNPGVQGAGEDPPTHLPFVGHGGNHTQALAAGVGAHRRSPPLGGMAAAAPIVRAQAGLVAPLNLGILGFGALGNRRIGFVEPLRDRCVFRSM